MMGGFDGRGLVVDERVRLGAKQVDCLVSGRVFVWGLKLYMALYNEMLINSLMDLLMGGQIRMADSIDGWPLVVVV